MIKSDSSQEYVEGLRLLASFINTKSSSPFYTKIIDGVTKFFDTEDLGLFGLVWKILKGIMKKNPEVIDPVVPRLISKFKKLCKDDELLLHLGELGGCNPKWVVEELIFIKEKLKSHKWNEYKGISTKSNRSDENSL